MIRSKVVLGLAAALALAAAGTSVGETRHDEMLRRLIEDAAQGRIPYQVLAPGLAEAVRPQAAAAKAELSALGGLKSVKLESTDKSGMEFYRTEFEKGALEWAFHVDGQGLIDNAIYRPAKAVDPS